MVSKRKLFYLTRSSRLPGYNTLAVRSPGCRVSMSHTFHANPLTWGKAKTYKICVIAHVKRKLSLHKFLSTTLSSVCHCPELFLCDRRYPWISRRLPFPCSTPSFMTSRLPSNRQRSPHSEAVFPNLAPESLSPDHHCTFWTAHYCRDCHALGLIEGTGPKLRERARESPSRVTGGSWTGAPSVGCVEIGLFGVQNVSPS